MSIYHSIVMWIQFVAERKGLFRTGKYFDEYAKMRQDCRVLAENFNFVLYYYKCSQCNKSMNSVTQ